MCKKYTAYPVQVLTGLKKGLNGVLYSVLATQSACKLQNKNSLFVDPVVSWGKAHTESLHVHLHQKFPLKRDTAQKYKPSGNATQIFCEHNKQKTIFLSDLNHANSMWEPPLSAASPSAPRSRANAFNSQPSTGWSTRTDILLFAVFLCCSEKIQTKCGHRDSWIYLDRRICAPFSGFLNMYCVIWSTSCSSWRSLSAPLASGFELSPRASWGCERGQLPSAWRYYNNNIIIINETWGT